MPNSSADCSCILNPRKENALSPWPLTALRKSDVKALTPFVSQEDRAGAMLQSRVRFSRAVHVEPEERRTTLGLHARAYPGEHRAPTYRKLGVRYRQRHPT